MFLSGEPSSPLLDIWFALAAARLGLDGDCSVIAGTVSSAMAAEGDRRAEEKQQNEFRLWRAESSSQVAMRQVNHNNIFATNSMRAGSQRAAGGAAAHGTSVSNRCRNLSARRENSQTRLLRYRRRLRASSSRISWNASH